jgi:hypothetical protein
MGLRLKKLIKPKQLINGIPGAALVNKLIPHGGLFNGGAQGGTPNPFSPPDLESLKQPNPYVENLTKNTKTYFDYKPQTDASFQDLVKNIGAPSSVDDVRKQVNGDLMNQLLTEIDRSTNNAAASTKLDFLDRGIGGPGAISDIEANAVAQVRGQGADTRAKTSGTFMLDELNNLAKKEASLRDAYSSRYNADVAGASSAAGAYNAAATNQASLSNGRDISVADLMANLYNAGANRQEATKKNSYLEDFLRNINVGIPLKF